ncbi:MAG: MATE family efflux transporter, partial [Mediterraneibacter gnavus]
MTQKQPINQITEGVIWKQLLLFFFPILLGTFFQQLYNTIDTVIVGQFVGKAALASVGGSSAQIVALIVGFFTGLSSGASVLIAQYFGANNEHAASDGLHNAYAISIVGGISLGILGFLATPAMLRLMNTPKEIMQDSVIYLRIYFAGILFVFLYNMGSSILRAVGDSKRPLYYLMACCLLNIILDALFVIFFHMGVLGVAVATLISQAFSAFLVTWKLLHSEGMLRLSFSRIRFHSSVLKNQLKLGLPTGFEAILFAITNIAIQSAVNTFGTDTSAAWSAYGK